MISWNKELNMRIKYLKDTDKRNSKSELHIRYVQHDNRISNPMEIQLPGTDKWITVDAEALRTACNKTIQMKGI